MSIALYWAIDRARSPVVSRTVPQTLVELSSELGVFEVAELAHEVGRQIAARQLAGLDRGQQVPAGPLRRRQSIQDVAPLGGPNDA